MSSSIGETKAEVRPWRVVRMLRRKRRRGVIRYDASLFRFTHADADD